MINSLPVSHPARYVIYSRTHHPRLTMVATDSMPITLSLVFAMGWVFIQHKCILVESFSKLKQVTVMSFGFFFFLLWSLQYWHQIFINFINETFFFNHIFLFIKFEFENINDSSLVILCMNQCHMVSPLDPSN